MTDVGTATAPTGITLVCEELGVRDDITETQLLAGTFGDLAEWLYDKHKDEIYRNLKLFNPEAFWPETVPVKITFNLHTGGRIYHPRLVSTLIRQRNPIRWQPVLGRLRQPSKDDYAKQSQPLEVAVEVARYVGAAGIGGIVGNRADAAVVWSAKSLIRRARKLWRRQRSRAGGDALLNADALDRDAAIACARAAVMMIMHSDATGRSEVAVESQQMDENGRWRVRVIHFEPGVATTVYNVRVPPGDQCQGDEVVRGAGSLVMIFGLCTESDNGRGAWQ